MFDRALANSHEWERRLRAGKDEDALAFVRKLLQHEKKRRARVDREAKMRSKQHWGDVRNVLQRVSDSGAGLRALISSQQQPSESEGMAPSSRFDRRSKSSVAPNMQPGKKAKRNSIAALSASVQAGVQGVLAGGRRKSVSGIPPSQAESSLTALPPGHNGVLHGHVEA
jgi:hypothetical protein